MQTDFITVTIQLFPLWLVLDLAPSIIGGLIVTKVLRMPIQQIRRPVFFEPGDVTWVTLIGPFFEELFFRGFPMVVLGSPGLVVGSIVWVAAHIPSRCSLIETYPRTKRAVYIFTYVAVLLLSSAFYITAWMLNGASAILYHVIHNTIAVLATRRREREKEKGIMIENRSGSENENEPSFVKLRSKNVEEIAETEEIAQSMPMFVKPKTVAYGFENGVESVEHVFVKRKRAGNEVSE